MKKEGRKCEFPGFDAAVFKTGIILALNKPIDLEYHPFPFI